MVFWRSINIFFIQLKERQAPPHTNFDIHLETSFILLSQFKVYSLVTCNSSSKKLLVHSSYFSMVASKSREFTTAADIKVYHYLQFYTDNLKYVKGGGGPDDKDIFLKSLETIYLLQRIEKYKTEWLKYVDRIPNDRLLKILKSYKPSATKISGVTSKRDCSAVKMEVKFELNLLSLPDLLGENLVQTFGLLSVRRFGIQRHSIVLQTELMLPVLIITIFHVTSL
ncbi:hypothetical protein C0J52_15982 [Blattella germanica]|nr:hypothetical protein C0J52_15982 [Blattella germanica]